jgi:Kef-type K+ transport system membrane component KefB
MKLSAVRYFLVPLFICSTGYPLSLWMPGKHFITKLYLTVLFTVLKDRVSLCSLGCPGT